MMEPTPLRPDEQVAGGFLRVSLGGQGFELRVLPMALSRKWLAEAKGVVTRLKGTAADLDSFEDVADFLAAQSEAMMDLLLSYDALGNKALPEREWIDTHATDGECWDGWKRVTAATSPLAQEALRIVPDILPVLVEAFRRMVMAMGSSPSTKRSPPSTDGRPTTSTPISPTSSLPSTSGKPPSARPKRPLPS